MLKKQDSNRQVAELQSLYPYAETIKDVGGGLNFKRKKLLNLLSQKISRNREKS